MINTNYDFRTGLGSKDPDKYSKELKESHIELLSRPFPNGLTLEYRIVDNKIVGHHNEQILFDFNPDSFTNSFATSGRNLKGRGVIKDIVKRYIDNNFVIKTEINKYVDIDYTIGSSIVFPIRDNCGSSKWTINQARGCSVKVQDRTDYTLECIRRFFEGNQDSPLKKCLNNYSKYFALFGEGHDGFVNYVKWFFLDDLVTNDYKSVKCFTSSIDFDNAFPVNEKEYLTYMRSVTTFIESRNKRIKKAYGYNRQ